MVGKVVVGLCILPVAEAYYGVEGEVVVLSLGAEEVFLPELSPNPVPEALLRGDAVGQQLPAAAVGLHLRLPPGAHGGVEVVLTTEQLVLVPLLFLRGQL